MPLPNPLLKNIPSIRNWGAVGDGVADDSQAMANAAIAMRDTGGYVLIPADCKILMGGAAQVWMRGMSFIGCGNRDMSSPSGVHGSIILITDTTKSPFVVSDSWGFTGLEFYWPNQQILTTNSPSPVVYPPLLAVNNTDYVQGFNFNNNVVVNAYDFADFTASTSAGHFHIENNQIFTLRYGISLQRAGGESWVVNNQFSPVAWYDSIAGGYPSPTFNWCLQNTEPLRIIGNGTQGQNSTYSVEGMLFSGNYILLARLGIHINGGAFTLTRISGNTYDACLDASILIENGGSIEASISGDQMGNGSSAYPDVGGSSINITATAGPNNGLSLSSVDFTGQEGSCISIADVGNAHLAIMGGTMWNVGSAPDGGPYPAIYFNTLNGTLSITGVQFRNTVSTNDAVAIQLINGKAYTVVGNTFRGWKAAVQLTAVTPGTYVGNTFIEPTTDYTTAVIGGGDTETSNYGNYP